MVHKQNVRRIKHSEDCQCVRFEISEMFNLLWHFRRQNTSCVKRNMAKAIESIRQTANEILQVATDKTKETNVVLLNADDSESLINGLKRFFDSSDYDERIRLHTLSPPSWGRVQIANFFHCNEWQSRQVLEIRNSFGISATPTSFSGNHSIDLVLVSEIQSFYQDDGH